MTNRKWQWPEDHPEWPQERRPRMKSYPKYLKQNYSEMDREDPPANTNIVLRRHVLAQVCASQARECLGSFEHFDPSRVLFRAWVRI